MSVLHGRELFGLKRDREVQRIEAYTSELFGHLIVFVKNSAFCLLFHPADTTERAAIFF